MPAARGQADRGALMPARFSIGIDLGTTNSALAFVPLPGEAGPEILAVPQWESVGALAEAPTLPSFLYLPEAAVAAELAGTEGWVVGQLARRKAGETPGRVVHSAKSWLIHHSADRTAPFLPWASEDLAPEEKISPVRASALVLNALRAAWNHRFAAAGFPFDGQQITVTVPASFDAAAQRLTLTAAEEAGFPDGVRLLEEPQAAFYAWLEGHDPARELALADRAGPKHVLVVDIGGGTSDFSLFELRAAASAALLDIRRVAVSEHILLGGDNIDLALAHLAESRLTGAQGQLSGARWDFLVAACRDLKERALSAAGAPDGLPMRSRVGDPEERFAVALPGRGSGLIAGVQSATLTRAEIESALLDGFFPECDARARPYRTQAALREWGLPYAADSAITRHLADFLRDRPRVDAVLFNGGSLAPETLRVRLREQIGAWQDGAVPLVLENPDPALAVARGAARFGRLLHREAGRIAAGAARAVFLEVEAAEGEAAPSLLCVLPRNAPPEASFEIASPALALRTDRLVRFQAYSSPRHGRSRAGDLLAWREGEFQALPPLQTVVKTGLEAGGTMPVHLAARMNALGLLQVVCVSADPARPGSWPLEFDLRPHEQGTAARLVAAAAGPDVPAELLEAARRQLGAAFARRPKAGKVTAAAILRDLEQALGQNRSQWNAALLRALWPALAARPEGRKLSADHEEAWLTLAGFLLRPGFGVAGDGLRIDGLWRVRESGPCFPGKRIRAQEYILWRRVAGGLSRERQERLLAGELARLADGKAPPELVRLAGALELVPAETKAMLAGRFIDITAELARAKRHCAPYLAALGLLLNRAPLYAGPETVLPPELVERAFAAFRGFDWTDPEHLELPTLFLRAARMVGDRSLDLPERLRNAIAGKLEKSGVAPAQTAKLKGFTPLGRAERASLYGEALPPGLLLDPAREG